MCPNNPVCVLDRLPDEWIVCFVPPQEHQWWHRFLRSRLKHCFAIKKEGADAWVVFEPWWSRILINVLTDWEAQLFLDWGKKGIMLRVTERIPGNSSQLRGWMTCAALVAHVLGRNYWVWTPYQLLMRLLKEPGVKVCS